MKSIQGMGLGDDVAEAIGLVVIDAVTESGLLSVLDASSPPVEGEGHVIVWTANAAEQIGATLIERFGLHP